jgi:Flp pilus assembly pilin Flp
MTFLQRRALGRRGLFARGDRGATAVEYALMVGLIAVVIVVAVVAFGLSVEGLFNSVIAKPPFNN